MANVFLSANETFTAANNGLVIKGAAGGTEKLLIGSNVTGVTTDANIERIEVAGNLADYKFVIGASGIQITNTAGTVIATIPSLNQASTLAFADGSASLVQTGATAATLGGAALSTTTAAAVTVTTPLNTTDKSTVTGTTTPSAAFTLTADAVTVTEPAQVTAGTNTTANMTFTVKLSAAQTTDTVVNYATSTATGDLATANADYTTTNGSVTIAKGATSATFTVPVIGDGIFDGTVTNPTGKETFTVTLSSPTTAFATSTVKGTITDLQTNAVPTQTIPTTAVNILMGSSGAIGTGITVADADNNNVTVVLTAANGLMTTAGSGAITAQNGLRTMTLTGSKTDVNAALAVMTYSSDRTIAGVDTITMETSDPLGGKSTTGTITVNVNSGGTFSTAVGGEAFTGTTGNDYYTGTAANIETTDTLAAGGGTADTLSITAVTTAALAQTTAFTGLEVVNVTTTASGARAATLDVVKAGTDVKTINFTDGDGATAVTTDDDSFTVTNLNTGSTVNLNNTVTALVLDQSAASQTVTLVLAGGVKTGTLTSPTHAATTFNIQSNGSAANEMTSKAFIHTTNVAITGDAALKLTVDASAAPLTINGNTAKGALTISNAGGTGTTATVITGGLAADTITGDSDYQNTLNGNDGNDTLTGGTGADTINGGAGDDSINGGTGIDTMTGGTGKDTYSVSESGDKVIVAVGDTGTVAAGTADVITGLVQGAIVDLTSYYTGNTTLFIADGNLAVATAGASSTLRDIYLDTTKKAVVIEMDATGTTTQEIYIGNASVATVANVAGTLTFGAVPMTSSVSGNKVVVEGQAPISTKTIDVDLAKAIPQTGNSDGTLTGVMGSTMSNVSGAMASSNSVDVSKAAGSIGVNIIGSSLSDTIVTGALATFITGGLGADTITLGTSNAARDSIALTSGLTTDTVNKFVSTTGATNDTVLLDISDLQTASAVVSGATLKLADVFGSTQIAASNGVLQSVTAAATLTDNSTVLYVSGTYATTAALVDALGSGGSSTARALTTGTTGVTANDTAAIIWSDGTDAHVGLVRFVNAVAASTGVADTDLAVYDLAKLVGVTASDLAVGANGNIAFVA